MGESATVRVNERRLPWREGLSVAQALDALGLDPAGVACALNGEFVARERRAATVLAPGDAITVFQPIVGG